MERPACFGFERASPFQRQSGAGRPPAPADRTGGVNRAGAESPGGTRASVSAREEPGVSDLSDAAAALAG
jgi:hypothetical protein